MSYKKINCDFLDVTISLALLESLSGSSCELRQQAATYTSQ